MRSVKDILRRSESKLSEIFQDRENVNKIRIAGEEVECRVSSVREGREFDAGDIGGGAPQLVRTSTVSIQKDLLKNPPKNHMTVKLNGIEMLIKNVSGLDSITPAYTIELENIKAINPR